MAAEYVRMSETERLQNLREDATRVREERKKAEQHRQEEIKQKDQELAQLRAQVAMQKEVADRDLEIARLRNELAGRGERVSDEVNQKQTEIERLQRELADANAKNQNSQTEQRREAQQIKTSEYPKAQGLDYETLKKTIYGHAKMEGQECQKAVAFVVLNRARANQPYWGGQSITEVCRKPYQFWPWNDKSDVHIDNWNVYNSIDSWLPAVLNGQIPDNTNGSDHLLPNWEHQDWLNNVDHKATHGNFNFYKSKWL